MATHGIDTTKVPEAVANERLDTCQACEYFTATRQCSLCHCFMDVKARLVFDPVESAKALEEKRTVCAHTPPKWGAYISQ